MQRCGGLKWMKGKANAGTIAVSFEYEDEWGTSGRHK